MININITNRPKMYASWFNAASWNKLKRLIIILNSFTSRGACETNGCIYDDKNN